MGIFRMSNKRKTAVMYGAGNIGRGFIGQVFHDSGYEVVFIDVNQDVISSLNKRNCYTQRIIEGETTIDRNITGVRAVDGYDREAVILEIVNCDIMAVSVGAAILQHIAPILADGIARRVQPLNILICENLAHAPDVLKGYVSKHLTDPMPLNRIAFVGATIGRMVPVMPPQQRADDPTLISVERFCTLPIDRDAVIRPLPELMHTLLCSPFAFEEGKKLYIHNMGHALFAYFGFQQGYKFIWQATEDESINKRVHAAMTASAKALELKYNEDFAKLGAYVDDLLSRMGNKGLGDTVARVGGDPLRKLAPGDRLIGAIDLCREQGTDYSPVLSGIAAALRFNVPGDPSAHLLREQLSDTGTVAFLRGYCGLPESDADRIVKI